MGRWPANQPDRRFYYLEIVKDVNGDGVRDLAMQAAADVLQAHPELEGIFGINAQHFRGETAPAVLPVAVGIVDKTSLQEVRQ